jgi:hypothetical protein
VSPPPNLQSLVKRIDNIARANRTPVRRVQRAVANVVVGQMIPPSVVKGGTAMKLRVGEAGSRFTPDFDVTRHGDVTSEDYLDQLRVLLEQGWGGFTGTVERETPPEPAGVPEDYVMQPFAIRLSYQVRHWLTVKFELGHDEIGSTANPQVLIAADLLELFAALELPEPKPVPVLAVEHQIAQKLHACTSVSMRTGTNERAHDLVDLQILIEEHGLDHGTVRPVCERLFRARQSHGWPPLVVEHGSWAGLYAEAASGLGVLEDVQAAVAWANDLIAEINRT